MKARWKIFFSRPRRGGVLPVTIIVTLIFVVLCTAMFSLAQMNIGYDTFFERRSILEQATLSLAQTLADSLVENANTWWPAGLNAEGTGELSVDSSSLSGVPGMKFSYRVTPHGSRSYILFVRGEYAAAASGTKQDKTVWGVSLDIYPEAADVPPVTWSKHVQLS
ncbi:MAG: hypothetical protein LBT65_05990 [Synergistaceae bacterium]|jgi:hypothetical protein|nr:hypothetical protein [Synergistaceae bacterium]